MGVFTLRGSAVHFPRNTQGVSKPTNRVLKPRKRGVLKPLAQVSKPTKQANLREKSPKRPRNHQKRQKPIKQANLREKSPKRRGVSKPTNRVLKPRKRDVSKPTNRVLKAPARVLKAPSSRPPRQTESLLIESYSEKSFVVRGETKPFKDELGRNGLGGKSHRRSRRRGF